MPDNARWNTGPKHPYTPTVGLVVSGSFSGSEPWLQHVLFEAARTMIHLTEMEPPFAWQVAERYGAERWAADLLRGYGRTVHDMPVTGDGIRDAVGAVVAADALVLIWDGDSYDCIHAMHAAEDEGVPYVAVELDQWGTWHVLRRQSASPTPWLAPHKIDTLGANVKPKVEASQDPQTGEFDPPQGHHSLLGEQDPGEAGLGAQQRRPAEWEPHIVEASEVLG